MSEHPIIKIFCIISVESRRLDRRNAIQVFNQKLQNGDNAQPLFPWADQGKLITNMYAIAWGSKTFFKNSTIFCSHLI